MTADPKLVLLLEARTNQFERSLERVQGVSRRAGQQIEKSFKTVNGERFKNAAASAQVFANALDQQAAKFARLRAQLDPAVAAEQRYQRAVEQATQAVRVGAATQEEANAVLARARTVFLGASGAADVMVKQGSGIAAVFNRNRQVIQNTAFQVQDFAVQLASGTSATRAFAQQAPQLLGGFGAVGAILGVVAAIGVPLAATLLASGDAAGEAGDKVKTLAGEVSELETALADYKRATEAAEASTEELTKTYGAAAVEARGLLERQAELARVNVLNQLGEAVQAVGSSYGDLFAAIERAENVGDERTRARAEIFRAEQRAVEDLAAAYGITQDEARQLSALLTDAKTAKGIEDQAAAVQRIREFLKQSAGSADQMNAEALKLLDSLLAAEINAAELQARIAEVPDSIRRSTDEALALSSAIQSAADSADRLASSQAASRRQAEIRLQFRDDPVGEAGALAADRFDRRTGDTSGFDPIVQTALRQQRDAFVETAEATERARVALKAYQDQQREDARNSRRGETAGQRDAKRRARQIDRFGDRLDQTRQRIADTRELTAVQAALNPLVDDYGFAVTKARQEQALLAAAQQAGIAITPQLRSTVDELATGYANASVEAQRLAQSQDDVRKQAEDFEKLARDTTKGFISDLQNGKDVVDALGGALDKVAAKLVDMAVNNLFDNAFGGGKSAGGIGGFLSGLLGGGSGPQVNTGFDPFGPGGPGFYASGGYTGSGAKNEPAGIVHKGEYVFDAESVKRIGVPNLERMRGYMSGGLVGAPAGGPKMPGGDNITIHVDAKGAQQGVGEEVRRAISDALAENNRRVVPGIAVDAQRKFAKAGG
ncbi:MAG: hypothetical protein AAF764_03990 [Pseudomonadota bacterium]